MCLIMYYSCYTSVKLNQLGTYLKINFVLVLIWSGQTLNWPSAFNRPFKRVSANSIYCLAKLYSVSYCWFTFYTWLQRILETLQTNDSITCNFFLFSGVNDLKVHLSRPKPTYLCPFEYRLLATATFWEHPWNTVDDSYIRTCRLQGWVLHSDNTHWKSFCYN